MTQEHSEMLTEMAQGSLKALARAITLVENELDEYDKILFNLPPARHIPVIGITGPPGAGKSTLVNCLIKNLLSRLDSSSRGIAVISVDPSSPLNKGAILGDRLRMKEHFINDKVFIRSLAARGALGGLSAKTIEVLELMRSFSFDYIIVETVGVGQSELEIAGLADVTLLVLTPEAGDDIQVMKSGVMEIADIYVVNKADRDGADEFVKNITQMLAVNGLGRQPQIVKTVAIQNKGIEKLADMLMRTLNKALSADESKLLAEKAYRLILNRKIREIDKDKLKKDIEKELKTNPAVNIYRFAKSY
jgi:LAO/AO transport system kinase